MARAIIGAVVGALVLVVGGWLWLERASVTPTMPSPSQPLAASPVSPAPNPSVIVPPVAVAPPTPPPPTLPPGGEMAFATFLAALGPEAQAVGVSAATFEAATAGLTADPQVLELSGAQPEHAKSVSEYVTALVSETRLENGLKNLAAHASVAQQIEAAYGVDRHVLIAIWGVESNYGQAQGQRGVIRSLATLAALEPRRPQFWKAELLAALRILQARDTTPHRLRMAPAWLWQVLPRPCRCHRPEDRCDAPQNPAPHPPARATSDNASPSRASRSVDSAGY